MAHILYLHTPKPFISTIMEKRQRLLSVDALRGFDMLLISGGGVALERLHGTTGLAWVDEIAVQLSHPAWNGFTFYDFIFPLFLFTAGIALSYSLRSGLARGLSKPELYKKALRRMLILMVLGILDKNIPLNIFDPAQIRYGTVLGRIGIATFITTLLYLNFNSKQRLYWVGTVLVAYCAALFLIPVPGYGAGDLSFEGNLVGWFDRTFMPGRLLQKTYDENALLTQLPAHCLTILGAFAGDILQMKKTEYKKLQYLGVCAVTGIVTGLIWNSFFPINKHLWTSSFIMLTAGMAFLFLAVFYWTIDVLGYRKWAFFFKVIGMNSLVIYLGMRFINFDYSSRLLFEGWYMHLSEKWHPACNALGSLILVWLLLYFLYKNKIFIKV